MSTPPEKNNVARLADVPSFTFAFQPIVDVELQKTVSYEALVRGINQESAQQIFQEVPMDLLHEFDSECRRRAIALAADLHLDCGLNLNVLPRSLETAEQSIQSTVEAAKQTHIPISSLTLEVAETEIIEDVTRFATLTDSYRALGLKLAIDDFGAGHSGLNLLADFQPDQIKLDRFLIRNIATNGPRQSIVRAIITVCRDLGIELVVEGVETSDEYAWFRSKGIRLFQGYLFARPGFQCFPPVYYPDLPRG